MDKIKVTFQYGSGNAATREFERGTTLGCALKSPSLKAFLGYGENVVGYIGGSPQNDATTLVDKMIVVITEKACGKAA